MVTTYYDHDYDYLYNYFLAFQIRMLILKNSPITQINYYDAYHCTYYSCACAQ